MISVVIVDDHPVYRQGLAMVVDSADDLELVAKARSIEEFDTLAPDSRCCAPRPPPARHRGQRGPSPMFRPRSGYPVLVLSAAGAPDDVVDAIGAGAAGYLTKDSDADEIARVLSVPWRLARHTCPRHLASYLLRVAKSSPAPYSFTQREPERFPLGGGGRDRPGHCGRAVHFRQHGALSPGSDPRQNRGPDAGPT